MATDNFIHAEEPSLLFRSVILLVVLPSLFDAKAYASGDEERELRRK